MQLLAKLNLLALAWARKKLEHMRMLKLMSRSRLEFNAKRKLFERAAIIPLIFRNYK
jgi:hypothetical protein